MRPGGAVVAALFAAVAVAGFSTAPVGRASAADTPVSWIAASMLQAELSQAEPSQVETTQGEPSQVETSQAETSQAEQPRAADLPKEAPCVVCTARGEGGHPEKVFGSAQYEGKTYYFCAKGCQDQFLANPAAYVPKSLPRPAPEFELEDLEGRTLTWEQLRGKPVLIDFWATWCKPCVKFFPEVARVHQTFGPKGLTVLGVAIDEGEREKVAQKVAKKAADHSIPYLTLLDDPTDPVWRRFGVVGIPATFLLDAQGQIVGEWKGAVKPEVLEAAIRAVLPEPE